jgi:hypothetical protein
MLKGAEVIFGERYGLVIIVYILRVYCIGSLVTIVEYKNFCLHRLLLSLPLAHRARALCAES